MLVSNDIVRLLMQGSHKTQTAVEDYQSRFYSR
jgi:hypothetical protein